MFIGRRPLLSAIVIAITSFAVLSSAELTAVPEVMMESQASVVEGFFNDGVLSSNTTTLPAADFAAKIDGVPMLVANATVEAVFDEAAVLEAIALTTGQSMTCFHRNEGCSSDLLAHEETKDTITVYASELDVETLLKIINRQEKHVTVIVNTFNVPTRNDGATWVVTISNGRNFVLKANIMNLRGTLAVNANGFDEPDWFRFPYIAKRGEFPGGKGEDGKSGHRGGAGGTIDVHVVRIVTDDPSASLVLSARGGRGGRGQLGGDGGNGLDGVHGTNVTWCSAEDGRVLGGAGTNGTAGGDGGMGGSGGAGGPGGAISVTIVEPHRISLLTDISAGDNGPSSVRGSGGEGGAAGRGGHGCYRESPDITLEDLDGPSGQRGPDGKRGGDAIAPPQNGEGVRTSSARGGRCPKESFVGVARAISAAGVRLQQRDHASAAGILTDVLSVAEVCAAKDVEAWAPVISEVQDMMAAQQKLALAKTETVAPTAA